jgi:hypothetical protein
MTPLRIYKSRGFDERTRTMASQEPQAYRLWPVMIQPSARGIDPDMFLLQITIINHLRGGEKYGSLAKPELARVDDNASGHAPNKCSQQIQMDGRPPYPLIELPFSSPRYFQIERG